MASSQLQVKKIILSDKLTALINSPDVRFDEVDAAIDVELHNVSAGVALDQFTDFLHLASFIKTKRFSDPMRALQIYVASDTTPETRKAMIQAIRMSSASDDKIYELICLLAKKNKLERYTQITKVTPLRFTMSRGDREYTEEHSDWHLIFELFGLCKTLPPDLIPLIAELLSTAYPSAEDLQLLDNFFKFMKQVDLLRKDIIEVMLPKLKYKSELDKLQLFLSYLQSQDLLLPGVLKRTLPLLETNLDTIKTFFNIYQDEIKAVSSRQETLEKLALFCQLSRRDMESYDDIEPANTPLHQAIIDRNHYNLNYALRMANSKLLLATSYSNTALILACKLADKEAAKQILQKMLELHCDVNQADNHGMTALHWARFYHFDDLCIELVAAGAKEELIASNGKNSTYFAKHPFTLTDFIIDGERGEIIEGSFKLRNCALTDIAFHADKIALNLKLATSKEVTRLFESSESAQIRSSNRFSLFFKAYRSRLVDWLDKQRSLEHESSPSIAAAVAPSS